jgi:hypothetical protein
MDYDLTEYDYLMVLRPYENDDGEMFLSISSIVPENDHPDDWPEFAVYSMLLMSAAYSLMSEDDAFKELVNERLKVMVKDMESDDEEDEAPAKPYVKHEGSNIIKLTRFTKTEGSA